MPLVIASRPHKPTEASRTKKHRSPKGPLHVHPGKGLVMGNCCSGGAFPGADEVGARVMKSADRRIAPGPCCHPQGVPMHHVKGTYPRCTRLQDGSLLGTLTAFDQGISIVIATRSVNEGQSWETVGEVMRGPTADHDLDNPYMIQCPGGKVLCAYRNHDRKGFGPLDKFLLNVSESLDGGRSWNVISTAVEEPAGPTGVWEPFLRFTADGRELQMYYARENPDHSQNCLMRYSHDEGHTWSQETIMVANGGLTKVRHGMIGVCPTTSPRDLFAVVESGGPNGFCLSSMYSNDDGHSWSMAHTTYNPRGTGTNANAPQVVNVNGILVCSFMTEEDGGGDDHRKTKVITSHDWGKTWANNTVVGDSLAIWPGIFHLGGNSVLVMYDAVRGPGAIAHRVDIA